MSLPTDAAPDQPKATKHARHRLKERAKLPKRAAERVARLALERGVDQNHPSLTPPLRAKILRTEQNNIAANGAPGVYRVYNHCLYIFSADLVFITVFKGFDDVDQVSATRRVSGQRWKNGERKRFKSGRRPRDESEDT